MHHYLYEKATTVSMEDCDVDVNVLKHNEQKTKLVCGCDPHVLNILHLWTAPPQAGFFEE